VRIELGHDIERRHDGDPKRCGDRLIVPQLTARNHPHDAQAGWPATACLTLKRDGGDS